MYDIDHGNKIRPDLYSVHIPASRLLSSKFSILDALKKNIEPAQPYTEENDVLIQGLIKQLKEEIRPGANTAQGADYEAVIKKLVKKLTKSKKRASSRDDRGIQTLFRTLSRNHYTLLSMIDRKASIILSVNSIIISLLLGGLIVSDVDNNVGSINLHVPIMIIFGVTSMIFAVIAISPHITPWKLKHTRQGVLFHGDFGKYAEAEYESEMTKLINDSNTLYHAMIRDIYYLGKQVMKKEKYILRALLSFIVGLVISLTSYIITQVG